MTKAARGEIWQTRFWPTTGAEISKDRPAVVLNVSGIGKLPLSIVVPITGWQPEFNQRRWFVRIDPAKGTGLSKVSGADSFQVKSVANERLLSKIGELPDDVVDQVAASVAICIGI
jgi:mRNA interferase MazF